MRAFMYDVIDQRTFSRAEMALRLYRFGQAPFTHCSASRTQCVSIEETNIGGSIMSRMSILTSALASAAVLYCGQVSAAKYAASDEGKVCKTSAGECGTVTKDRTQGSTTFNCEKGGGACGMKVLPSKPMTEIPSDAAVATKAKVL